MEPTHSCCHAPSAPLFAAAKAIDPVCGMTVDPETTPHHATFEGEDYHFCSAKCRERFAARPEIFLEVHDHAHDHGHRPAGEDGKDAVYTCPMHPEVEQIGPGTCPLCGMAL